MEEVFDDDRFAWWEASLPEASRGGRYVFILKDGSMSARTPEVYSLEDGHAPAVRTPDWAKDAIWYQIMVDRFRSGTAENDPDRTRPWTGEWYAPSPWEGQDGQSFYEYYVFSRLYGGDFQGLAEKLDYLKELGVTALYLNPVFQSPSHHKYNATNFVHIDEHYGVKGDYAKAEATENLLDSSTWTWTPSDRIFLDFLKAAKARGMRVVLDGVFNHVGATHPAFLDVRRRGKDSPFADWFAVRSWDPFEYDGWAGFGELPVFAKSDDGLASEAATRHIYEVTRRWMDPDGDGDPSDGIDGWRLDVPNEVPLPFWVEWRKFVKAINPDAYITGEIWKRADQWLDGRSFDAVMNYPFAEAAIAWVGDRANKIAPSELDRRLAELRLAYPAEVTYCLMNLLDSHDTDRIASMLANPRSRVRPRQSRTGWRRVRRGQARRGGLSEGQAARAPADDLRRRADDLLRRRGRDVGLGRPEQPQAHALEGSRALRGSGREPRHGGAARVLSPRDGAAESPRGAAPRLLPHVACRRRAGRLGLPARVREREGACRAQRLGPAGDGDGAGTRVDAGRLEARVRPPSPARRAGSLSRARDPAGLGPRVGHRAVSANGEFACDLDGTSIR